MRLGVNLDHVATLRQARMGSEPDVIMAVHEAMAGGADGITLHLREDRRHIQDNDVAMVSKLKDIYLNLEMAATPEMMDFATTVQPQACCIVPEKRKELTTEGGLDVVNHHEQLNGVVDRLLFADIDVALFIDPDRRQLDAAKQVGAQCVELHTGDFAHAFARGDADQELHRLRAAVDYAKQLGLRVHAGHGLNLENLRLFLTLDGVLEVNIGHALVSRALFVGLKRAVSEFKQRIHN